MKYERPLPKKALFLLFPFSEIKVKMTRMTGIHLYVLTLVVAQLAYLICLIKQKTLPQEKEVSLWETTFSHSRRSWQKRDIEPQIEKASLYDIFKTCPAIDKVFFQEMEASDKRLS